MRLGDLDALKKTFENACIYGLPMNELYGAILKIIDNAPTVEPERPKGEWQVKDGLREGFYICSNCGEISCCKGDFCTDCGADMRGDAE